MVAYVLAYQKGLNAPSWAWASLFFVIPVLLLPFVKSRLPEGSSARASGPQWDVLAAYDPDVRAAIDRLAPLGQDAIEDLQRLYTQVDDKGVLSDIVADLERKWTGYATLDMIKVEVHEGVDIMRDAQNTYHVAGRQTGDLRTAQAMASASARRARGASRS